MKLEKLTTDTVYVDTNLFYMYLRKDTNHFSIIKNFLNKVISGKMRAYTSVLTMDELFYRLLLAKIKKMVN